MNDTLMLTVASEINQAHAHAIEHADSAIGFARQAGELLLQVKDDLPHGAFLTWLAANCTVSDRQARRYMAAAQGKPVPIRKLASTAPVLQLIDAPKTDTVSDLTAKSMPSLVVQLADGLKAALQKIAESEGCKSPSELSEKIDEWLAAAPPKEREEWRNGMAPVREFAQLIQNAQLRRQLATEKAVRHE